MVDLRIIGDVHEEYDAYGLITKGASRSIQVGDMGFAYDYLDNFIDYNKHRFFGGNHENYSLNEKKEFAKLPRHHMGNGGLIEIGNDFPAIFYVRGASSIDAQTRLPGFNWWPDEELSTSYLEGLIDMYFMASPSFVLSHTAPISAIEHIPMNPRFGPVCKFDRTAYALEKMFSIHQPKVWLFGHWHCDIDVVVGDTRFICLDILSYADFNNDNPFDPIRIHCSGVNAWRKK